MVGHFSSGRLLMVFEQKLSCVYDVCVKLKNIYIYIKFWTPMVCIATVRTIAKKTTTYPNFTNFDLGEKKTHLQLAT